MIRVAVYAFIFTLLGLTPNDVFAVSLDRTNCDANVTFKNLREGTTYYQNGAEVNESVVQKSRLYCSVKNWGTSTNSNSKVNQFLYDLRSPEMRGEVTFFTDGPHIINCESNIGNRSITTEDIDRTFGSLATFNFAIISQPPQRPLLSLADTKNLIFTNLNTVKILGNQMLALMYMKGQSTPIYQIKDLKTDGINPALVIYGLWNYGILWGAGDYKVAAFSTTVNRNSSQGRCYASISTELFDTKGNGLPFYILNHDVVDTEELSEPSVDELNKSLHGNFLLKY